MVSDTQPKTGYWRINPDTGEREWIEGSYPPKKVELEEEEEVEVAPLVPDEEPVSPLISSKELYEIDKAWADWWKEYEQTGQYPTAPTEERFQPYYEQWLQTVKGFELEQPALEAGITPEMPTVDVTELAERYNISGFLFVSPEQLADLALAPEERAVRWQIPYEQYLTWEQARWLGYDVPEGSVVRMTPMAEGEPSFFLMPEPEGALAPRAMPVDLESALRNVYADIYSTFERPGYGSFAPEDIPSMVLQQIQFRMMGDFQGFVDDLYERVGEDEGERVLKLLGVTEEFILQSLDYAKQEERVTDSIQAVFPDYSVESFGSLIETDFPLFIETMQTGGSSVEKRKLLEEMGYTPEEINQIFSRQRLVVDVDGIRRLLTIDIETQTAYDDRGNYVGSYNPATREFTRAAQENILKDFWDWTVFQSRTLWEQGENFMLSVIPEILFRDIRAGDPAAIGADPEYLRRVNEGNRQLRENFRWLYGQNKQEYDDWVRKHPELLAPVNYQEGAFQHPELLKDPRYYAYELANIIPFIVTATGMALATGGVGLPAILGTAAIMVPVEGQAVYEDLINAGAPERNAAPMALFAGTLIGLLESAGRIPLLKQVSPLLFGQFKRKAISELAKRGLFETIKRFGRAFTIAQFAEVTTEVAQEVISNLAVSFYDENRSILDNLPDIAVKTAVATILPAGFGAGVSVRMVSKTEQQGLTDIARKAKGWIQDEKGNWFETIRGERGFVRLPGEPVIPPLTSLSHYYGEPIKKALGRLSKEQREVLQKQLLMPRVVEGKTIRLEDIKEIEKGMPKSTVQGLLETEGIDASDIWTHAINPYTGKVLGFDVYMQWQTGVPTVAPIPVTPEVTPPVTEVGMPEAGIQPAMIPEVPAIEVRPPPKAEVVQISMEDQLKLEQARQAAEEAPAETKGAYEAQAEIEGLRVTHQADPVAQVRVKLGGRNVGLDAVVSIREQIFPEYFTLKQAQALYPGHTFGQYTQKGTPQYNKVPRDVALDQLTKELNMSPDEIADRVMAIRREKRRIKELGAEIKTQMTEKPLTPRTELTTTEVTENWETVGKPKYNMKQIDALVGVFADYLNQPSIVTAWELTRELRRETMAGRAENLKARAQELIVKDGLTSEEAIKQAIRETLAGELPAVTTEYLEGLTEDMRDALFAKLFHVLKDEPFEMASTVTALTNALAGRPIPREPGVRGGSAFTRLQRVFGDQPKVLKAIDKMAEEKKPLKDVVEGLYHETGREPIPIDQETADYLRGLQDIPQGYKTLLEPPFDNPIVSDLRSPKELVWAKTEQTLAEYLADGTLTFDEYQLERTQARDTIWPPVPPTRFDPPIDAALGDQAPLFPRPAMESIVRVLKELAWLPVDIGGFIKANLSSVDMSYLRQVTPLIPNHKTRFALSFVDAWKALFSQKEADAAWTRIVRDPDMAQLYAIYDELQSKQGRDFLRPAEIPKGTAQWRGVEEFGYLTKDRLLPRITGWLPWVKLSQRAFVTGTNSMTWGTFKDFYKAQLRISEKYASGELTLRSGEVFDIMDNMDRYATMLADWTGRASLGRLSSAAPIIGNLFYAPRYALGKAIAPRHLFSPNSYVRKEAWKDGLMFVGVIGGTMLVGAALGFWEVELDRRSADYMKIRIGTLHIDPWGGSQQFVVFLSRLYELAIAPITGKNAVGVSSVTGAEYRLNVESLIENMIKTKQAPLIGLFREYITGRTWGGEEVDWKNAEQWVERLAPMSIQDFAEAMQDDQSDVRIAAPASFFGLGVQTYTGDWEENWTKLGLRKYYDVPDLYYDTADFWADTAGQFKDVDLAKLTVGKGFPEYIRAIAEARIINEHLSTLPSEKLVNLNADANLDEPTFTDYHQMWLDRQKLVTAGDEAEFKVRELQPDGKYKVVTYKGEDAVTAFDKKNPSAENGNFSQRQFALLNEYWAITDPQKQKEFLKEHKDEIGINPREDWLRKHSSENAQLAVWGQAKIYTREAFNEFNSLIKSLDIPDNALPELTVPPETSWDTHITYEEMVSEGIHGSVEADLLLLKDHLAAEEAGVQSYVGWRIEQKKPLTLSDKSLEYLQLRVDNADLYTALEEAMAITIKTERDAAVEAVRATKVGDETFRDIERRVDAMGNGTREAPIPPEIVDAYVAHMQIVDETSGNSAEAKLNRYDNPDLNDFLMNGDYHGKQAAEALDEDREYLDNYLVPRWRIDVQYRTEDAEYDAIPGDDREARDAYLAEHPEYRADRRRREALSITNTVTGERFPLDQIENFVGYYELEAKGKRQERFLVENGGQDPENLTGFAEAMHNILGIDIPKPQDVPSVEYDNIYDEWKPEFERWEGLDDHESEFYIEDTVARQQARDAMMFTTTTQTYSGVNVRNKQLTAFGLAQYKREAYANFVPEEYVNDYVGWKKISREGKPEDWALQTGQSGGGLWFEDDWYMMEHIEFYRDVYRDLLGNEKWDFTTVPTREVFDKYLTYIALPHLKAKDDYRWGNRDLDAWLVLRFDYTPIAEKKRRQALTPYERFLEEWAERQRAIEEALRKERE